MSNSALRTPALSMAPSIGLIAATLACSPTPNILPTAGLNRPTDMAFLCLGAYPTGGAELQVSGRPMFACHPTGPMIPNPQPGIGNRTFAFVPNSASGDLTVIDADRWKVVDLVSSTGGFGRLPVGALPEQLSTSTDGCRLLSTNRGSCDLTVVDPAALLAPVLAGESEEAVAVPDRPQAQRVPFRRGDGSELAAAPYEAVFLPQSTLGLLPKEGTTLVPPTSPELLCAPDGQGTRSWRALVTFPGCDLVALVDLPSGDIVDSLKVTATSAGAIQVTSTGTMPSCPVECGARRGTAPPGDPDAGMSDGAASDPDGSTSDPDGSVPDPDGGPSDGGTPDAGTGADPGRGRASPSSIAIVPNGQRAYIGLAGAPAVLSLALTPPNPQVPAVFGGNRTIVLADGAGGTNRVRLGVDPYRYESENLDFPGEFVGREKNRNYLYAIARDGSVRVIDVSGRDSADGERECETNPDLGAPSPMPLPGPSDPRANCLPIGPDKTPRRPGARGPGLTVPFLTPVDVAAARIGSPAKSGEEEPFSSTANVLGAYAWVLTNSGTVYLINIDPVRRQFEYIERRDVNAAAFQFSYEKVSNHPEPVPYPNTIRDRNQFAFTPGLESGFGPPRVELPAVSLLSGPYIETFWTQGTDNNARATETDYYPTQVYFPDRYAVTPQPWTITWEGTLTSGLTGIVGAPTTGNVLEATFEGSNFCAAGVRPGDTLTISGCRLDSDCNAGQVCRRDDTLDQVPGGLEVTGICLAGSEQEVERRAQNECRPELETLRRYEIVRFEGSPNVAVLRPHRDEIVFSSLTPCQPCADPNDPDPTTCCDDPMDAERCLQDACSDPVDPSTTNFRCYYDRHAVRVREPGGLGPPRCLERCTQNSDCRQGRVCIDFDPGPAEDRYCADAALPGNTSCFREYVPFQVNMAGGFLVAGARAGNLESGVLEGTACVPTPGRDPRYVARIPLEVPPGTHTCTFPAGMDAARFRSPTEPPLATAPPSDAARVEAEQRLEVLKRPPAPADPAAAGNLCLFEGGRGALDTTDQRRVRAVFRNSQVAFVLGNLNRGPLGRLTIRFDVRGGFLPQTVRSAASIEVSMPARLVVGPVDALAGVENAGFESPYLFVVDQRRLGRGQGGGAVRGQILRINPFLSISDESNEPGYEDFARSGNLFPIQ